MISVMFYKQFGLILQLHTKKHMESHGEHVSPCAYLT